MRANKALAFLLVFLLPACLQSSLLGACSPREEVTVELLAGTLSVANRLISIGDVANITGADASMVNKIRSLDLEYLENSETSTITRQQVQMRILVSESVKAALNFTGAESVAVKASDKTATRESIEIALARAFATQFAVAPENVRARLLNTNSFPPLVSVAQSIDTAWFIFSPAMPFGETKVRVNYTGPRGDGSIAELQCHFTVLMDLVVATEQIQRGTVLSEKHVARVTRPINESKLIPVRYKDCIGKVVASDIPIHSVVQTSHVESRQNVTLINRNDRVDVLLRKPGFQARLPNAKALNAGSRNDTIQVLTSFDRKLSGVVIDKGLVEIR